MERKKLITVQEAAKRLGYSDRHVHRLIREGRLTARRVDAFDGNHHYKWEVSIASVTAFIRERDKRRWGPK